MFSFRLCYWAYLFGFRQPSQSDSSTGWAFLFGFRLFSWETLVVTGCLLLMIHGLVRLAVRRQTEMLKEYLRPDHLPVERFFKHADNLPIPDDDDTEQPSD